MTVKLEFSGDSLNDVLEQISHVTMPDKQSPGLDSMSLQELLLYTSQRAEAEGYDMEVKRPPAVARKEEARAKLRGDLEESVKQGEAVADAAPAYADEAEEDPTAAPKKTRKAKAAANGKSVESDADRKKRCIASLQKLYADGHKTEVNKILADFGSGVKNFNAIPDDLFVGIEEAMEALKL